MKLHVFPNTGHQYFNLSLADLLPDKNEDFLNRLVRTNRDLWQPWRGIPWVLYQYATVDEKPCLKVAIETNLGLPSRGLLFDYDDETLNERPNDEDELEIYAARDEASIKEDFKDQTIVLKSLPNKEDLPLDTKLEIHWPPRGGWDPVDVDLIVDLGNTRTIALLLERPGDDVESKAFGRRSTILRFLPRGAPYAQPANVAEGGILADDCGIIDSWLLLQRPLFYHLEPPANRYKLSKHYKEVAHTDQGDPRYRLHYYLPHTFVELSPALVGGGRSHPEGVSKTLASIPLDQDVRFTLSSPKRYAWDDRPQGHGGGMFWFQIPSHSEGKTPETFEEFKSLIRYFMEPSGADWDIDNPPCDDDDFPRLPSIDAPAEYPRRDAICWFALSIIEAAYRQINAEQYLRKVGRNALPRRLRNIRVTYPAGWIHEERTRYFEQWQRAINLFTLTRFEDHAPVNPAQPSSGGSRPILINDGMDEAICSQLPILYADVTALGGPAAWIELYGRDGSVNVMNVDVGGGTTDLAIIQYRLHREGGSVGESRILQTRLLFRDGYSVAGDNLVKRLIERALLPSWLEASAREHFQDVPAAAEWVKRFLQDPAHAEFNPVDPRASMKMMRITRLVFIPLVNTWLQNLAHRDANPDHAWEPLNLENLVAREIVDPNALRELNDLTDSLVRLKCPGAAEWRGPAFGSEGVRIHAEIGELTACIDEVFGEHFNFLGELAGRFDSQLIMVSGKPSELPRIRELITDSFPVLPQRIIHVKNFPAGGWYPFSSFDEGRIADAKTCTVVGAALFQDIRNGEVDALNILPDTQTELSRRYYWNVVNPRGPTQEFHRNYLFSPGDYPEPSPGAEEIRTEARTFDLPANGRIGRQLVRMPNVRADPVYEVRWRPSNGPVTPGAYVRATLRWVSSLGEGERLVCEGFDSHPDFPEVLPEDVSFKLNTLFEESYWLDKPAFEVEMPSIS